MAMQKADPQAYRLAFEQGQRGLDDQEAVLAELHTRAATLLAAAALVTSFFGGQVLPHGHVPLLGWLAIACFIALAGSILAVLWPRKHWEFDVSPTRLISEYIEPPDGQPIALPDIHRDLALHMDRSAAANRRHLQRAMMMFRVGVLLLVFEVVAWVVLLARHP